MRCEEGLLDVETVLQEDERGVGVGGRESGRNEVGGGGRDVGDILGGEEDVVVGGQGFLGYVGDGVAD